MDLTSKLHFCKKHIFITPKRGPRELGWELEHAAILEAASAVPGFSSTVQTRGNLWFISSKIITS